MHDLDTHLVSAGNNADHEARLDRVAVASKRLLNMLNSRITYMNPIAGGRRFVVDDVGVTRKQIENEITIGSGEAKDGDPIVRGLAFSYAAVECIA